MPRSLIGVVSRLWRRLPPALLLVAFLDEFAGGVPIAGAADVTADLGLGAAAYALAFFGVLGLVATFIEAPILAWSDAHKGECRGLVVLGMVGCGLALAVEAAGIGADNVFVAAVSVVVYFPCSGLACGLAEAILVDETGPLAAQALARWTLAGVVGDVAAPALVAIAAVDLGIGDTVALAVVVVLGCALVVGRGDVDERKFDGGDDDEGGEEEEGAAIGVVDSLRFALTQERLLLWTAACALCSLLDETFAVLLGLAADAREPGAGPTLLVCFSVGASVGVIAVERALSRWAWTRLLVISSALCAASFVVALVSLHHGELTLTAAALIGVGMGAAPLWPLTLAACHEALPGRPGLVGAVAQLFHPVDMVVPVALGALADGGSPLLALAIWGLQPVGVLMAWTLSARKLQAPVPAVDDDK